MRLSEILVLTTYGLTLGLLALYGCHRLFLVWVRLRERSAPNRGEQPDAPLPRVTVQLPLFNERMVVARLLRAVARLDYPSHLLEIQVLDDSTDGTSRIVAAAVRTLRARGIRASHTPRETRTGFKAGALEAGRRIARGELLAIFDADFVPPPDFLHRVVPAFRDPRCGMVQACWGHLNAGENLMTRIQGVMLDGHFAVEHRARASSGRFFNFNGTAGVWRRQCLEDAGGWSSATLTEDLDISYRAQLAGWRFRYLPDLVVPAELPSRMQDFKSQQTRWARGSIQTCRLLLGRILRSTAPWKVRCEAFFHLTSNLCYPLMLVLALVLFPAQEIRHRYGLNALVWMDAAFLGAGLLSLAAFYGAAARRRGVLAVPGVIALGLGLSLTNTVAVARGLLRDGGTFRRTPKSGGRANPYRSRFSFTAAGELALGAYLGAACVAAVRLGLWPGLPFLMLFAAGFLYSGIWSMLPRRPWPVSAAQSACAGVGDSPDPPACRDPWASRARTDALPISDR